MKNFRSIEAPTISSGLQVLLERVEETNRMPITDNAMRDSALSSANDISAAAKLLDSDSERIIMGKQLATLRLELATRGLRSA